MKWIKRLTAAIVLATLAVTATGLYYVLPRHDVVYVTGVEVKRVDDDGVINAENPAEGPTRDIYFVNTENPDTKQVRVYRNEDTGWGFPWYFKFDSADVQARAQGFSRDSTQLALIRYYGWRIQILSMFPNITHVEATKDRNEPLPIFNIALFILLGMLAVTIAIKLLRLGKKKALREQL
ncbi:DUF1523 family protein [Halopseudomonas pelagia]|uniref:DUF1523 family protein n=1 Tax=Halopseudomonas pelagia TaxID=553151 RepID=A0AA91U2H0_9GAMM|nr:DUF1523 family protein [Halopseudomonas pelagia]PCC99205.1 hypothetical protein CO192_11710 [Halopseudomonas pelagia]QFY57022.1 DUF1523 family protein [Halopseudomonas pelagia]